MEEIRTKHYVDVKKSKTEIFEGGILSFNRGDDVIFSTKDVKKYGPTEHGEAIFAKIKEDRLKGVDIEFSAGLGPNTGKLHILNKDNSQKVVYRIFAIKDDSVRELETNVNTRVGNNTYVDVIKNETTLRFLFTSGTDNKVSRISVEIEVNPEKELGELS